MAPSPNVQDAMLQLHLQLPHMAQLLPHLAVGDVAGDVPYGKDTQQAVVIPPRVVHHPAGGLKPTPRPQPIPYPGGLLLWAVEAVLAMEDSGLVCLAEPGDEKRDLQGKNQAVQPAEPEIWWDDLHGELAELQCDLQEGRQKPCQVRGQQTCRARPLAE